MLPLLCSMPLYIITMLYKYTNIFTSLGKLQDGIGEFLVVWPVPSCLIFLKSSTGFKNILDNISLNELNFQPEKHSRYLHNIQEKAAGRQE